MLHVVCRPIAGPVGEISPGILVDASRWRNRDTLVSQRYLRAVTMDEAEALGDITIETDEHGLTEVNLFAPKPKPVMKVRKAKKR